MKNINILKRLYIGFLALTVILIIFTPIFINRGLFFIEEEPFEAIIITLLFATGYLIYSAYKKESENAKKQLVIAEQNKKDMETRLTEAFRYIGAVNVQIQEIKNVFSHLDRYPENKQDIKYIFEYMAGNILGIIDVDWVLLRIINLPDFNTLREHCGTRSSAVMLKHQIHNKNLIKNNADDDYMALTSDQTNLNIKAFVIFPRTKITENQKILIKAIVNQLEMLFIIFAFNHNQRGRSELMPVSPMPDTLKNKSRPYLFAEKSPFPSTD